MDNESSQEKFTAEGGIRGMHLLQYPPPNEMNIEERIEPSNESYIYIYTDTALLHTADAVSHVIDHIGM